MVLKFYYVIDNKPLFMGCVWGGGGGCEISELLWLNVIASPYMYNE